MPFPHHCERCGEMKAHKGCRFCYPCRKIVQREASIRASVNRGHNHPKKKSAIAQYKNGMEEWLFSESELDYKEWRKNNEVSKL
jgi:NADH:ubiquinone oxidoreductase subunit F (NADH-binding)